MATRSLITLTRRECEILQCLAAGRSNREIAGQLNIAVPTVQNHLHSIFDKLWVSNRTMAVVVAQRQGLLKAEKIDDLIQVYEVG